MAPPFRADHIGSLLRPPTLRKPHVGGGSQANFYKPDKATRAEQEHAISDVVHEQLERGITPITSGEYERNVFYGGFFERLDNFEDKYIPNTEFRPAFPTARKLFELGIPGRNSVFGMYLSSKLSSRSKKPP